VADAVERKRSQLVVGLDPVLDLLPVELRGDAQLGSEEASESVARFCCGIVDAAARFLPSLGLSLVGGATADAYNRRNIIRCALCVPLACSTILAVATLGGWVRLELIYALVLLIGFAAAFEGPARSALLPMPVSRMATSSFKSSSSSSSSAQTGRPKSWPASPRS